MQQIDYHAIVNNAKYFANLLQNCKLCAVLKNDAYGHDIVRTASYLYDVAYMFAVGNVDEAESIAFTHKDTLILLPQDARQTCRAVSNNFVLTVDGIDTLKTVICSAQKIGKHARVHIKIDSGMSRLGLYYSQLNEICDTLAECDCVDVEGVYSHFWGDNCSQFDKQLTYFDNCCKYLTNRLQKPLIKHIANTCATLCSSKYHLDMVRIGLGLYGYGCDGLSVAKTVTAKVISVKRVNKGSIVGYCGKYVCRSDTNIAVIDVGYAQGFSRALSGAFVTINGKRYQTVGNVCMSMCMVDVGNDRIAVGDSVILLGERQNPANFDVIVYELLCNLR